jgi:hypothetical protein
MLFLAELFLYAGKLNIEYKDFKTTLIYAHVLNRGGKGVKRPVDDL